MREKLKTPAKPKERKCLMCREPFMSEWPGERVCRKCKATNAWRQSRASSPHNWNR